ncbi:unnamed protein product, partial [Effrenium voratum]
MVGPLCLRCGRWSPEPFASEGGLCGLCRATLFEDGVVHFHVEYALKRVVGENVLLLGRGVLEKRLVIKKESYEYTIVSSSWRPYLSRGERTAEQ